MNNQYFSEKILPNHAGEEDGLIGAVRQVNRDFLVNAKLADPNEVDFTKPKDVEFWAANFHGIPTQRMIIYLRSDVGCEYGQKSGGCLACRHWRIGTAGKKLDIENMFVRQAREALTNVTPPHVVALYNEGNVLNDRELPHDQLIEIMKMLSSKNVGRVILESRPEYISDEVLRSLKKVSGAMEIEVGIGLESVSNIIRNAIFLKGMSLSKYETSVDTLKRHGMRTLSYVIIKPPFLTEAEGLEEAVATSKYAFSVGSNVVSLEPIGVEPSTITEVLYKQGLFEPATLWSSIEVMKEVGAIGETRLGGTQFSPRPTTLPHNCSKCTDDVVEKLELYNATYDPSSLTSYTCECRSKFVEDVLNKRVAAKESDVRNRLSQFVHRNFSHNVPR